MNKPKFCPLDDVYINNVPSYIDHPQQFLHKVGEVAFVVASEDEPVQYFYILDEVPFLFPEKDLVEPFDGSIERVPFFRLGEIVQVVNSAYRSRFGDTAKIISIDWNVEGHVIYNVEFNDGTQHWYFHEDLNQVNRKVNIFRHRLFDLADYSSRETYKNTVLPLKTVLALAQDLNTLPDHF